MSDEDYRKEDDQHQVIGLDEHESRAISLKGDDTAHLYGTDTFHLVEGNEARREQQQHVLPFYVARHYRLPRNVVVKSLEKLDSKDSPERPGMLCHSTVTAMVSRFDKVFVPCKTVTQRAQQVEDIMQHLRRHTRRRRGEAVLQEGFVEWEQTSRLYELFAVDLNVCERIFFTVDVGETTSQLSKFCSFFLIFMIIVSILLWMLSTLPGVQEIPKDCVGADPGECEPEPAEVFKTVERICVYVFTLEYFIRISTVHSVRFALLDEPFLEAVLTGGPTRHLHYRNSTAVRIQHGLTISSDDGERSTCWSSEQDEDCIAYPPELDGKLLTMVKYIFSPSNLIDLLAILPYWIVWIKSQVCDECADSGGGMLMVLRVLRLTRVFRVFKLGKYNEVFTLFSRVVSKSSPALGLMLFFISLGCCLFGTLIWFTEQGTWYPQGHEELLLLNITDRGAYLRTDASIDQNLEESPFQSIIHSFWYIIVTITTVGYGDLAPTTALGKLIGSLTILNGIIVLAMPIGVVGANFSSEYYRVLEDKRLRQKSKRQLEALTAAELEQDKALRLEDSQGTSSTITSLPPVGLEFHRIDGARSRILADAESLDSRWQEVLPRVIYDQLARHFMQFVSDLLCGPVPAQETILARPVISVDLLNNLDALSAEVQSALRMAMSVEDLSEFGLREAHQCRRAWAAFVDKCWEYATDLCRVEDIAQPPEFFETKARLMRLPVRQTQETCSLSMGSLRSSSWATVGKFALKAAADKSRQILDTLPGEVLPGDGTAVTDALGSPNGMDSNPPDITAQDVTSPGVAKLG